jgi:hypothetical protein
MKTMNFESSPLVYFGQLFEKYRGSPRAFSQKKSCALILKQMCYVLGDFFAKTSSRPVNNLEESFFPYFYV